MSVAPSGSLQITAPLYTPLAFLKLFLKRSRTQIDELMSKQSKLYTESTPIGKSHFLQFYTADHTEITYKKPMLTVTCPKSERALPNVQEQIRKYISKALRTEAKSYLPRRLQHLAALHGYSYASLRFTHAKSRWGSCSSEGVISLNIALMQIDHALIDYVLLHELAHTKEMNHSPAFWQLVERTDPVYMKHRSELKAYSPYI